MNLQTILTIVAGVGGFVVGVGFIPFLCYGVGSLTPAFIAEPVANLLFKATLFGQGPSTLHQNDDDSYELRRAGDTEFNAETPRKWGRWAMQQVGYSFDSTKAAWGTLLSSVEKQDLSDAEPIMCDDAPEDAVEADLNRGGRSWWAQYQADGLRVRLPAALNRLKGRSNLAVATRSLSEGLKEHGGDTSDMGMKWQAGGFLFILVMSGAMGFVVFF